MGTGLSGKGDTSNGLPNTVGGEVGFANGCKEREENPKMTAERTFPSAEDEPVFGRDSPAKNACNSSNGSVSSFSWAWCCCSFSAAGPPSPLGLLPALLPPLLPEDGTSDASGNVGAIVAGPVTVGGLGRGPAMGGAAANT